MKQFFSMFAAYNAWANRRLYDAASKVPDGDYRAPRGAFFSSLHGTLNHLLVADRIWMHRFTGTGPYPNQLDAILCEEFDPLREARAAEDARIGTYVEGLSDADIAGTMTYRTIVNPQDITQPRAAALAHFFNHQTHHRGQAHCLVTTIAGNAAMPSLDMIIFQRELP